MRKQFFIILAIFIFVNSGVYAVNVTHEYNLNGTYADTYGGPDMIPNGGALTGSVYKFEAGQGPSLSNAINPSNYSIEMLFTIMETSGYRRLLEFKNLTTDLGLYNLNGKLNFYNITTGASEVFAPGQQAHLVVTRDGSNDNFIAYVNGIQQINFTDSYLYSTFNASNNIIQFLRDDNVVSGENSRGYLDQVRIYDGALTQENVTTLYNGGTITPEPSSILLFIIGLGSMFIWKKRENI